MRHSPWETISSLVDPGMRLQSGQKHIRGSSSVLSKLHSPHAPASDQLAWRWSYASSQPGAGRSAIKAGGHLITDNDRDGDGIYQILGITGQRNGVRITGLVPAGTAIPGNIDPLTGIAYVVNNQIQQASQDKHGGQLNTQGIGFALADGSFSNIFFASYLTPPIYLDFHSQSPFPAGLVAPNTETAIHFQAEITNCHF